MTKPQTKQTAIIATNIQVGTPAIKSSAKIPTTQIIVVPKSFWPPRIKIIIATVTPPATPKNLSKVILPLLYST